MGNAALHGRTYRLPGHGFQPRVQRRKAKVARNLAQLGVLCLAQNALVSGYLDRLAGLLDAGVDAVRRGRTRPFDLAAIGIARSLVDLLFATFQDIDNAMTYAGIRCRLLYWLLYGLRGWFRRLFISYAILTANSSKNFFSRFNFTAIGITALTKHF